LLSVALLLSVLFEVVATACAFCTALRELLAVPQTVYATSPTSIQSFDKFFMDLAFDLLLRGDSRRFLYGMRELLAVLSGQLEPSQSCWQGFAGRKIKP
jgi:hypothetical protein